MAKYNIGDKVICIKYSVGKKLVFDSFGSREENYVDSKFFNVVGKIKDTYKSCMEKMYHTEYEDKGEYEIEFEDGTTLSWVTDKELIPLVSKNSIVNDTLQSMNEG